MDSFTSLPYLEERKGCVIVINGLNAIIKEQQERFGKRQITITEDVVRHLDGDLSNVPDNDTKDTISRLLDVDLSTRFILSHPENILNPKVKGILMKEEWSCHITHVVIDEAHLVLSWGNKDFRPDYLNVGLLRTFIPDVRMVALTATANKKSQGQIITSLQMINPVVVTESPNRPNVFLDVKRRPATITDESVYKVVDPYIQELKLKGLDFPKTVMYVPLKWCGILHQRATLEEENKGMVAQYHAPQSNEMKTIITQRMHTKGDSLRLVFATEAYGTGIDVPDIKQVVHIGPPNSLETYVQEIGRCGRDGQQATSVLYFNNTDVASNKENLKKDMRDYTKNSSLCRREFLLNYFEFSAPDDRDRHLCCDVCRNMCECDICLLSATLDIEHLSSEEIVKFSPKQKSVAKSMLLKYFEAENKIIDIPVPHLHTGLSNSFAESLSKKPCYMDKTQLSLDYPMIKDSYLLNISAILAQVHNLKL